MVDLQPVTAQQGVNPPIAEATPFLGQFDDPLLQHSIFGCRALSTFVIRHSGLTVACGSRTGAVTLIQRFGSALNLNVHLHMLVLDGAYTFAGSRPTFHRARRPASEELNTLLDTLSRRIVRLLERRGLLIADPDHPYLDLAPSSRLDHLQAASINYRIAIGPHAGRKALTLYSVPPVEKAPNNPLLARLAGFSLHAATVCEAWQRRPSGHGGLRACSQEALPACRSARAADWSACAATLPDRHQTPQRRWPGPGRVPLQTAVS
jgi:hypothetical protein